MKLIFKIACIILLIALAIPFWPFAFGGGIAWYVWKKKKIRNVQARYSLIALCLLFAIFAGTGWVRVLHDTRSVSPTPTPTPIPTLTRTYEPSATPSPQPTELIGTKSAPTPVPTTSVPTATAVPITHVGAASLYPNYDLTPGEIFPNVTAAQVCIAGYSASVRDVPVSEKKQVFAEYGIDYSLRSNYEVDHFISLELGGDNALKNLWPEPGASPNQKDKVENYLHKEVCNGTITLQEAQREIATDWYAVYLKMGSNTSSTTHQTNISVPPAVVNTINNTSGTSTTTNSTTITNTSGATGLCNDGTPTYATHHQGACSHHGGVKEWY